MPCQANVSAENWTRHEERGYFNFVKLLNHITTRGSLNASLFAIFSLISGCLVSCNASKAPPLATVDQVGPLVVEPGDTIRIIGTGFVEGPARIALAGTLKPAGLADSKVRSVFLDGIAVSRNLIEVPVTSGVMRQLTDEPGQFKGSMEVTFPEAAALDAIRIIAESEDVLLNLRPAGGGVPLAALRSREAARLLGSLGLVLLNQQNGDGLLIDEIVEGSPAASAGIEFGDRLLAVDGTAIAVPADLAGVSLGKSHRFELISHRGTIREVVLNLGPVSHLDTDELTAIVLSSIALGLFLAFIAPTRRQLTPSRTNSADPLIKAIGFGVVSIPMLLIPAGAVLSYAGFGASASLFGLNVFGLAGIAFFSKGTSLSRVAAFLPTCCLYRQ